MKGVGMVTSIRSSRSLSLLFALTAISLAGCVRPSAFRAPIAKFRDASAVVIDATKTYLTELNKTERDMYINSQASKPAQIRENEIEEVQGFSKDAIAVRLNALDQLANSDAPDRIKAKADDLKTALTGLSGEVSKLGGPNDANFKEVSGRVLPVIGDVLQAFAERKIDEGLKKAINTGAPAVNQFIQAIADDVEIAFQRKKSAFSEERVRMVDHYNKDLQSHEAAAVLKADANAIIAEEDRWEAFLTADPKDGLEAMKRANDALAKFASTPKHKITDFGSFVDAIESFAATANRVGKAVHELTGK
jgi:signal transduction protein with GAF and PtsI domain